MTIVAAWIITGCIKAAFVLKGFSEQAPVPVGESASITLFCIIFWPFMGRY